MKLNAHKFSLAAAATMGVAYAVCAVFTAVWPDVAIKFLGWMLHFVNVEKFADGAAITFGTFFLGLAPILFYSYFTAYLFAWLYNSFTQTPD